MLWFILGVVAGMLGAIAGNKNWNKKIWEMPFKWAGKLVRWGWKQCVGALRSIFSGLYNGLTGRSGSGRGGRRGGGDGTP